MEKQSFEWEEEDIQRLIDNQRKEATDLEYKRCDALVKNGKKPREKIIEDLSKDVSSFANAGGGTIIYGVIEEGHLPKKIDKGFNPAKIKREWIGDIEDIIDSNVEPKIDGLKIKQVELNRNNPGKVIYIIYILQSLQGAIQAKDYRYYQRRNFKAEPMEEYQVRDVMNRFKYPLLKPEIDFKRQKFLPGEEYSIKKAAKSLEVNLIKKALIRTKGNHTHAARLLEISYRALLYKIKEYGIVENG